MEKSDIDKSKGHVMFLNGYEYLKGPDGTLYKARTGNYIDINGYRVGARFEGTPSTADRRIEYFKSLTI